MGSKSQTKAGIYVSVWLIHFAVKQKLRQQCKAAILPPQKMWNIYTMEYFSAIKKKETIPFAAIWMQREIIIVSKGGQKEKDKHHMIPLICGI